MTVVFSPITEKDRTEYPDYPEVLDNRTKVTVADDEGHSGYVYLENTKIEKLGKPYIERHVSLFRDPFPKIGTDYGYFVNMSEDDFYNSLDQNPRKEILVKFIEIEPETGREVYKGIESGRYYVRDVSCREPFAKWLICGKRRAVDDGNEPRANLVFVHGKEQEMVRYHDWSGVAAYSDTFNPRFR